MKVTFKKGLPGLEEYNDYEIKEIEQRPLDALRYYYLPLPNDELLKNPNLKNNMGWNNN